MPDPRLETVARAIAKVGYRTGAWLDKGLANTLQDQHLEMAAAALSALNESDSSRMTSPRRIAEKQQPSSSVDPDAERPSNDHVFGVSPQVREEACEAVEARLLAEVSNTGSNAAVRVVMAPQAVDAAIPVIAEAAYKAGQEKARENLMGDKPVNAALRAFDRTRAKGFTAKEQMRAMFDAALAAIDKEGEN